jgi:hypothetical protein
MELCPQESKMPGVQNSAVNSSSFDPVLILSMDAHRSNAFCSVNIIGLDISPVFCKTMSSHSKNHAYPVNTQTKFKSHCPAKPNISYRTEISLVTAGFCHILILVKFMRGLSYVNVNNNGEAECILNLKS